MPMFSHRFPKVTPRHDENPDKIRAFAIPEDDPKRITEKERFFSLSFLFHRWGLSPKGSLTKVKASPSSPSASPKRIKV